MREAEVVFVRSVALVPAQREEDPEHELLLLGILREEQQVVRDLQQAPRKARRAGT